MVAALREVFGALRDVNCLCVCLYNGKQISFEGKLTGLV